LPKASTRREELLLNPKDLQAIRALRRSLVNLKPEEGARKLIELLETYPTNEALLNAVTGD